MGAVYKVTLPKWGLSMESARVNGWLKPHGAAVKSGDELVEIETEKLSGVVESPGSGVLRRQLVQAGEVTPVGSLLAVVADAEVSEAELDAAIADFFAHYTPKAAADGPRETQPEKVTVGSRSLRYLRRGQGDEAVILIHGFGGDLNAWLFNHEALAKGRVVYALDLPGHGESTKDVGSGACAELAQVVAGFMEAVGAPAAHLVGHSMGGAVAMTLAARLAARVRSLALLASAGLGVEINGDYIEGFLAANTRNALKPHLAQLFADPGLVTRRMIDDLLKYKRLEGVEECLRRLAEKNFPNGRQAVNLRDELARLRLPTLVVWGDVDRVIPPSHAGGLAAPARAQLIPGKGHMVMMEAAGEVNRLLNDFWA